jgi:hypothetical protein
MGWTAEKEGFHPRQEQGMYLSSKEFISALGPIRSIFPEGKTVEA